MEVPYRAADVIGSQQEVTNILQQNTFIRQKKERETNLAGEQSAEMGEKSWKGEWPEKLEEGAQGKRQGCEKRTTGKRQRQHGTPSSGDGQAQEWHNHQQQRREQRAMGRCSNPLNNMGKLDGLGEGELQRGRNTETSIYMPHMDGLGSARTSGSHQTDDESTVATEELSDDEESREDGGSRMDRQWGEDRVRLAACCAWDDDQQDQRYTGLDPPRLSTGARVSGSNKRQLRRENKAWRLRSQDLQPEGTYWQHHKGQFCMPPEKEGLEEWRNMMCPRGLALHHPAATTLLQYATGGCPTNTGRDWTIEEITAAVERGPHSSALEKAAIDQLKGEIDEKVRMGQCRVVEWDAIRADPPPQLKVSPLAMIPHKSRGYRAILDLSFRLKLKSGGVVPSVNEMTTLEAPAGAIDQMGHALQRIIHAFAEADKDEKIFMAKFDIKDGFWRLDCQEGEEWNFAYVLPQHEGEPTRLVVPTSLQMGWVESPPYFCAASETARDVAGKYVELPMGELPGHKFIDYAMGNEAVRTLPYTGDDNGLRYFLEVYVDDFIQLAVASTQQQLQHVAEAVLHGIHDVFPADPIDDNDPISLKKLKKGFSI